MKTPTVLFAIDGQIATITLNRPDKLNAIDMTMLTELEAIVVELEQNSAVRVAIITGNNDRAFCAGADINAWSGLKPLEMWRQWIRDGHWVFGRLTRLPQPTIAALNGYTFGGGLELALAADIRLAAEGIKLGFPEVKIGTVPAWTGSQRLPLLIGPARAKQMIFSGAMVEATTAERWGLVNEVVPAEQLMSRANELAAEICANAPIAVQVAKQLIDGAVGEGTPLAIEALASGLVSFTEDGQEGAASFRERRPPAFTGN
jgi:enoyl-CoA hydratase/carnithine racemase